MNASAQTPNPPAGNSAPVWTATAPGRPTLLLLPTIHMLTIDDPRIDEWLAQIAGRAQAVVLEGPLSYTKKELQTVLRLGLYGTEDNLTNHVTSMTTEELARCARLSGLDIVPFLQLKPWLASMTVNSHRLTDRSVARAPGINPSVFYDGIDVRLFHLAQQKMIPLIYLETLPQALKFYDEIPTDAQDAYLQGTCNELTGRTPGDLDINEIERAWLNSDVTRLGQLITTRNPHENQSFHDANQYILRGGTKIFAASLERYGYFHGKGPILIAVGAGHFFGDDSLLTRLEAAGYSITAPHSANGVTPVLKAGDRG
ncbi:TraB/GumN family protein [Paraburkholderia sediminicola]